LDYGPAPAKRAGNILALPPLNVDIAVSGLLRDLLGLQRMGGLARSEAKAAAKKRAA